MDLTQFSPSSALITVVLLALAPFVAVMVTSFTKIVVVLALLVLDGDHHAGGDVRDAHRGVGGVDRLPTRAARAIHVDADLALFDLDVDLFGLGEHGDRAGRGVDAPLVFGGGHALHAVHARLVFEVGVGALAHHHGDHLFEAALRAVAEVLTVFS